MNINFENKYAYAEVYEILNWLGDEYKRKVPRNLLTLFKEEKKFGYRPKLDFNKPLSDQVRQETKNIIAYLEYSCWLEDEKKKEILKSKVTINSDRRKQIEREKRKLERSSGNASVPLNTAIDRAIKNLKQG